MLSQVAQANNARAYALEAKGKKVVKDETFMQETIRIMKAEGKLKTKKKVKLKVSGLTLILTKLKFKVIQVMMV